jgi:hypothetical protein
MILLIFLASFLPQYEYAEANTVKIGTNGKDNAGFYFTDSDSAKIYDSYKIPHILQATKLLESKGWELITITTTTSGNLVVSMAYFRRKK